MKTVSEIQPFGFKDKLGYMFGDFGNDLTFLLSSVFLLKFYTDVMNVDAYIVGIVMMFARFIDAFTDVAMGRICDNSKVTRVGKFKPWILKMNVPTAISSFLIYQSSLSGTSLKIKIIWLFATYILWGSFFYTSVNIPYGAMASTISEIPKERQSLSVFRTIGGLSANIFISVVVPLIVYDSVIENSQERVILNGSRFTAVVGIFSAFSVICYLLCYKLVTERVYRENDKREINNSVFNMLKNAFNNRALLSMIVASVFMLTAQITMQQMEGYIFPNYYRNASAQSMSTVVMALAMLVSAVVTKPLCARYGKAEVSSAACIFSACIFGILFIFRPENVWIYIILQGICRLGNSVFSVMNWALITDVIDYSEIKNGIREDGSIYALYSFARKTGQAIASGLTGSLLSFVGYTEAAAFDKNVLDGIYNISVIVPGVGFLFLGLVLLLWFPLHKKQVEENSELLKQKNNNGK